MNKKLLCAALLGGLGVAQAASAQDFDDRWYVAGSTGVNFQDNDRGTEDSHLRHPRLRQVPEPELVGRRRTELPEPGQDQSNPNLWWSQYGVSVDARYHFRTADRTGGPTSACGLGCQRHEEEFVRDPASVRRIRPAEHEDNNVALNLGAGLQFDFGRVDLRTEVGYARRLRRQSRPVRPSSRKTTSPTSWLRSA